MSYEREAATSARPATSGWVYVESRREHARAFKQRIAAAIALRSGGLDPEEAPRLRVVVDQCASPEHRERLRVAVEVDDEEMLAQTLEQASTET